LRLDLMGELKLSKVLIPAQAKEPRRRIILTQGCKRSLPRSG
jgi:hypothetical protein